MKRIILTLSILTDETLEEWILTLDSCIRDTGATWEILASTETEVDDGSL